MCEKRIFSGFVTKTAESRFAWFSSLLQNSWVAEKEEILIPTGSWFLRRMYFLFCSCISMWIINKINLQGTYWLVFIGGDIDYFLPWTVSKYTAKYKYHGRKNQRPIGMNHCTFSAAQNICSKLKNQAKCDSAAFTTNPQKMNFSYTFWLLQVAMIAITNYNC